MKTDPIISLIVAHDRKRGIGIENRIPWHIPADLKKFKEITLHKPVIMGRKTFESILDFLKKPLPERENIVVTRDRSYSPKGCTIVHSLEEAIQKAKASMHLEGAENPEICIIGGAMLFDQSMELADRLYVTTIDADVHADTFFPEYGQFTKEISRETSSDNGYTFTWLVLEKP